MPTSLKEWLEFATLWVKKQTGVHLGSLVVYPAMVRHCLCCNQGGSYSHDTFGLCERCVADQTCRMCEAAFTPSRASVGIYCEACWKKLETTWTETFVEDPVEAENAVRSLLLSALPPLTGCHHVR